MTGAKILIVDDSAQARESVRAILEATESGFQLYESENGAQGLKHAAEIGPDLIISDLEMPILDGQAFCRLVKQNQRLRSIPFVMVTTRNERESKLALIDIGVDDYLSKPVDPRELTTRVRSLLRLRRATLELEENHRALQKSRDHEVLAQKAAFAGRLAMGLAHEFNNPLGCMMSDISFLRERMAQVFPTVTPRDQALWNTFVQDADDVVAAFERALKRIASTIADLQALRGSESLDGIQVSSADDLVADAVIALERVLGEKTAVELSGDGLLLVAVRRADVTGAIVLLLRFLAKQAPHQSVGIEVAREQSEVLIGICAPKVVLEQRHAQQLFDPSLVVGDEHRMRLSVDLSVCAANIGRSGGTIRVVTHEDTGTRFEIRLAHAEVEHG